MLTPWKKSYGQPRSHIKKQRHYFANKGPSNQSYGFSSNHVWMLELDYKESWVPKNLQFWTVVFESTLESLLDCKEVQLVHPKGNQSWIFIGRTDVESEALKLWPPDAKGWLTGKVPYGGKDWGQEEKEATEKMIRWHHQLNGQVFEQAQGDGEGQRSLECCSPVQFSSVTQSCLTLCDPMNCSTPGLPVQHQLLEFTQTHVHWVGDTIQPSHPVFLFFSCLQFFPASGSFLMSQLFASGGQSVGVSALASFLPKNTQGWSPSACTGWISLQSKGLSRVFSNTTVQKHQFFGAQLSSQSNSHIHTWPREKP